MQLQPAQQRPHHVHHVAPQEAAPMHYNAPRAPMDHAQRRVLAIAHDMMALEGRASTDTVIEIATRMLAHRHARQHAQRSLMALVDNGHLVIVNGEVRAPLPMAA